MKNNRKIKIYEVGGSIRNEILGLPPKDKDYAVLAPSYNDMRDYLINKGAKIFLERPEFVSIRCKMPELGATDFTLARKESFYSDGRHPDSVSPADSIVDDLKRRDFTMNAIAKCVETGEIIDPFNGREDIKERVIRCVGNPSERFKEDSLRVFRAIRFSVTLNMRLAQNITNNILMYSSSDFRSVSGERIREELNKMFEADTMQAFGKLREYPNLLLVATLKGIKFKPTLDKVT